MATAIYLGLHMPRGCKILFQLKTIYSQSLAHNLDGCVIGLLYVGRVTVFHSYAIRRCCHFYFCVYLSLGDLRHDVYAYSPWNSFEKKDHFILSFKETKVSYCYRMTSAQTFLRFPFYYFLFWFTSDLYFCLARMFIPWDNHCGCQCDCPWETVFACSHRQHELVSPIQNGVLPLLTFR